MFKLSGLLYLSLILSVPLAATAQDVGDPDSDSAPIVSEPEANMPPGDNDAAGINSGTDTDETSKVVPEQPLPGAHLMVTPTPQVTETLPQEEDKWHEMKFARLQGLNKVTAKTSEIRADINTNTKFGNLELTVEKCLRGPENEKVENTVLLTIWDEIPGQDKKQIFHGWMFSSSPALSALEHPIYDIILLGCGEAPQAPATPAAVDNKKADAKTKKPKAVISVQ